MKQIDDIIANTHTDGRDVRSSVPGGKGKGKVAAVLFASIDLLNVDGCYHFLRGAVSLPV